MTNKVLHDKTNRMNEQQQQQTDGIMDATAVAENELSLLLEYMNTHEQRERTIKYTCMSLLIPFVIMAIVFSLLSGTWSSGIVIAILGIYFLYWELLRKSILRAGTLRLSANDGAAATVTNVRDSKRTSTNKEIQLQFTDESGTVYKNKNDVWFEIDCIFIDHSNTYRGPIDVFTSSGKASRDTMTILPRSTVYLRTAVYSQSMCTMTYWMPFLLYFCFSLIFIIITTRTIPPGVLSIAGDRILTAVVACVLSILCGTILHKYQILHEQFVSSSSTLQNTNNDDDDDIEDVELV